MTRQAREETLGLPRFPAYRRPVSSDRATHDLYSNKRENRRFSVIDKTRARRTGLSSPYLEAVGDQLQKLEEMNVSRPWAPQMSHHSPFWVELRLLWFSMICITRLAISQRSFQVEPATRSPAQ